MNGLKVAMSAILATLLVGPLTYCDSDAIDHIQRAPTFRQPPASVALAFGRGFRASGGWMVNDCQLALIGARWGSVVLLDSTFSHPQFLGYLPDFMEGAQVSGAFPSGALAIWSRNPKQAIRFPLNGARATRLPSLGHVWALDISRPIVPVNDELLFTVAVGDVDDPQPTLGDHGGVPSLALYDATGSVRDRHGTLSGDRRPYLAWYSSLAVPGRTDSGVAVVDLNSATVRYFTIWNDQLAHVRSIQLPRYFTIRSPSIQVVDQPWIDEGGEVVRINHLRDLGPVAIAGDGYVTAVRTYAATREWVRAGVLPAERLWRRGAVGIEVYSPRGERVFAAPLTTGVPTWLSTSRSGRVAYGIRGGGVTLLETRRRSTCPMARSPVTVILQDTMP